MPPVWQIFHMKTFEESASPADVQFEQVSGYFLRWHGFVHQQQQRIQQVSGDLYLISVYSHKGRNGKILEKEKFLNFWILHLFFPPKICPRIFCCRAVLCSEIKNRASLHRFFPFLALGNPEVWRKGDFNWKSRCPTGNYLCLPVPSVAHSCSCPSQLEKQLWWW